jgi:hypothetical protein
MERSLKSSLWSESSSRWKIWMCETWPSTRRVGSVITNIGTLLFALDYNTGLYVFDVKSPVDYAVRNFTVHLTRCKAFNFHQQTFFILASTLYQTDYAVEVFVDFVKGTYYLNKYHSILS